MASELKDCGACGDNLAQEAFSKKQWSAKVQRRCKCCIAAEAPLSDGFSQLRLTQAGPPQFERLTAPLASKKKPNTPARKECANCLGNEEHYPGTALSACTKCLAVHYCSAECQRQHWKPPGDHGRFCVAVADRQPSAQAPLEPKEEGDAECAICLEALSRQEEGGKGLTKLECGHEFHWKCVEDLRSHGVAKLCPLCRASVALLDDRNAAAAASERSAEDVHDEAYSRYFKMEKKVHYGYSSWGRLTVSERKEMGEVVALFRRAAGQGHAGSQYSLGQIIHHGYGVTLDHSAAAKWYAKSARQGHKYAQFNLGVMYKSGHGVKLDYEEAVRLYTLSAEQGYDDAQDNLGYMYGRGFGVEENFEEGVKWHRKAAEQGNANAQFNMGNSYLNGNGVEPSNSKALEWYMLAADQGHEGSQFNVGVMFYNGKGVQKSLPAAWKYFNLSAAQGNEKSREILQGIRPDVERILKAAGALPAEANLRFD